MAQIKINNVIYGSSNASDIIYKNTTVEEKLNSIPIFDPSDNVNIEANQYDYLTYGHIYDGLNSSDTSKALSANQGKVLNEKINNIERTNNEAITALDNRITENTNSISDININVSSNRSLIDSNTNNISSINRSINELNNKIPFSFGIDANGNYGYKKAGADSVTPFNQVKELTFNVCQSNPYSTGTIHIYDSKEITKPGVVSCGWVASAVTNYIRFTTTAKELYLYGILTYQVSTSYSHNFSITGCDYEILEDSGNKVSGGVYAKIHLYNIPANAIISLNCYTSYSAVSGIGYLIYEDRY